MRIATRQAAVSRGRVGDLALLQWEHDGLLVDSFTVSVDGVETDLGALSPISGTTYQASLSVTPGAHDVVVYAVNENGRSASIETEVTW